MNKLDYIIPIALILFMAGIMVGTYLLGPEQPMMVIDKSKSDTLNLGLQKGIVENLDEQPGYITYEIDGESYLEIRPLHYYNGSSWNPVDMNLESDGDGGYKIEKGIYKVKIKNNTINISDALIEDFEFEIPLGPIIEVTGNKIIYDISDNNYNATLTYTFNEDKINKLITLLNPLKSGKNNIKKYDYKEKYKSKLGKELKKNNTESGKIKVKEKGKYWDYKGQLKYTDLTFSKTDITISIDKKYLEDAKFPVYLDPDLDINGGTITLGGNYTYDVVIIRNGGTLRVDNTIGWLNLTANKNFTIENGSQLDGKEEGTWTGGSGGSGGAGGFSSGATAGGPGGTGQAGDGTGASGGTGGGPGVCSSNAGAGGSAGTKGDLVGTLDNRYEVNSTYAGEGAGGGGGGGGGCDDGGVSGNGGSGGTGGRSGASVKITSPHIYVQGIIDVSAGDGGSGGSGGSSSYTTSWCGGGGGGGAGGSAGIIILDGNIVDLTGGIINAKGGSGGSGGSGGTGCTIQNGGNGATGNAGTGGRIKIFYGQLSNSSVITNASAGTGTGTPTQGTVYYEQTNQAPQVNQSDTVPAIPILGDTVYANITVDEPDSDNIIYINFTVINPTGALIINQVNGTNPISNVWQSGNFNIPFADTSIGQWNWTVDTLDDAGLFQTFYYNFTITDNEAPIINFTNPLSDSEITGGIEDYTDVGFNLEFNITDNVNISSCSYNYNGTNYTISDCLLNNSVGLVLLAGNYNFTIYATDTSLNLTTVTHTNVTLAYNTTHSQWVDDVSVLEGKQTTFHLYVNSPNIPSTTASLFWNNTEYPADSITKLNSSTYEFGRDLTIPLGIGNSTGIPIEWYWNYSISGVVDGLAITPETQTVYGFEIGDCGTYDYLILNYTLYDEETNTEFSNGTDQSIEADVDITSRIDNSYIWEYHGETNTTNLQICVPSSIINLTSYRIDVVAGYEASLYTKKFWYLDNGTLDNSTIFDAYTGIHNPLRDLPLADSTSFLFSFEDEFGVVQDGVIVTVLRYYIGDGTFREVERSKADDNGETHVHLVQEDVIYKFRITLNGEHLYTSEEYNAKCLSQPCSITLKKTAEGTGFPTEFDNLQEGTYNLTSNRDNRTVTLTFNLDEIGTMNLSIWEYSNVINSPDTLVTSDSLTAKSGEIEVIVPLSFGNKTYYATVHQGTDNPKLITSKWVDFNERGIDYFGTTGLIISALIVLTLGLMAVSSGPLVIIFLILGLILSSILGFMDMSYAVLIYIIVAGGIVLYKLADRRSI